MSSTKNLAWYLLDPEAVAAFQKLSGLYYEETEKRPASKGVANGSVTFGCRHEGEALENGKEVSHANACDQHLKQNGRYLNGYTNGVSPSETNLRERRNPADGVSSESPRHDSTSNGMRDASKPTTSCKMYTNSGEKTSNGHVPATDVSSPKENDSDETKKVRIENKLLYYLFCFGASLGNDVFYITFYPFCLWNIDSLVMRQVVIIWVISMYFGQAAKDIIRWPRPKSPPVVRLEKRYELEYGMPSTHAMVGTTVPFSLLLLFREQYEFPLCVGIMVALSWSLLVGLSRLYLGMHSVLDVLVGYVLASFFIAAILPWVGAADHFFITSPWGMLMLVGITVAASLLYPTLDKWSTARGDTVLMLGIAAGLLSGCWANFYFGYMYPAPGSAPAGLVPLPLPTAEWSMQSGLRLMVGVVFLASLRMLLKRISLVTLCWIWGLDWRDPATKTQMRVEMPYKYFTYSMTSFQCTFTMPLLFKFLGIAREAYFNEVVF